MQAIRRVTVPLTEDECNALRTMANAELRDPRDQARYLLRAAMGMNGDAMPQNTKSDVSDRQVTANVALS